VLHDQTNEIKNRHKQRHATYEIEHEFKARRAQGGKGLLSHAISAQSLQESIPKILSLERKEGGREGDAWEERLLSVLDDGQKGEKERVRGREGF